MRYLTNYDLQPLDVRLVARRDNAVYRVRGATGAFTLRVHREGISLDEVAGEMAWLAHLAPRLPGRVPAPVLTREGAPVAEVEGRVVTVVSWVPGRVPRKPSRRLARGLGEALAAVHLASAGFKADSARVSWDANGHFGERLMADLDDLKGYASADELGLFRRRALGVQATFRRLEGAPRSMLHGDLYPLNVLFQGDRLGVIDFANGGPGPRVYDLAVSLRHWPGDSGAIRSAYEQSIPLSESEVTALPAMMQARMLHMAAYAAEKVRRPGGAYDPSKLVAWAVRSLSEAEEL